MAGAAVAGAAVGVVAGGAVVGMRSYLQFETLYSAVNGLRSFHAQSVVIDSMLSTGLVGAGAAAYAATRSDKVPMHNFYRRSFSQLLPFKQREDDVTR